MGFDVTAANVIFFIAALTAGSAALDAWWDSARGATEAKFDWARDAQHAVTTNLTILVASCNSSCDNPSVPVIEIDVRNSGKTTVDVRNLTVVIDSIPYFFSNFFDYDITAPNSYSGTTDLILPGETMQIEFRDVPVVADYDADDDTSDADDLPVKVMTGDGVMGGR